MTPVPVADLDAPETTIARRAVILRKGFLRSIYEEWYGDLAAAVEGQEPVLEIGAGGGFLADRLPRVITSDLLPLPHVRLTADAMDLPLRDGSIGSIVMTNVLHHLPDTERFFAEAARVVRSGGRISMIEPWTTSWSRFVYSRFHHEPFDPETSRWQLDAGGPLSMANGALPWMIFERDRERFEARCHPWRVCSITPLMPFSYLISGGLTMRGMLPGLFYRPWRGVERRFLGERRWAMFARITLERH